MMKARILLGALLVAHSAAAADRLDADSIRAAAEAKHRSAVTHFLDYLAVPNDGRKPEHIAKLADYVQRDFEARGFTVSRLATPENPLLLAERPHAGAKKTLLVYLQADGQPTDASAWRIGKPYTPEFKQREGGTWVDLPTSEALETLPRDARIFARSASDSKGPNIQFLTALDILDEAGHVPDYHLKVVIDTEEELGSPHLADAVLDNREALAADMLMIFDGPPHGSGAPTLSFGARGIATLTLKVFGPKAPQHSGHYGNFIPNPALRLAQLLASMKDDGGRVTIPGYYDGITISDEVRAVLARVPDDEVALRKRIGFVGQDAVAPTLQEARQYPSLNIRGMRSLWVGNQVRTLVPHEAIAEIDVRLVKESDPKRLIGLIRDHIAGEGYFVLEGRDPTDAERLAHDKIIRVDHAINYNAYRTDFDSLPGRMARAALTMLNGTEPILIRTSGGSIPISPFVETLNVPAVSVPTVNPDNNQHSPDENIRLGNFLDGIATIAAVLAERVPDDNQ